MSKNSAQEHTLTPLEGYLEYSVPPSLRSSVTDGGTPSRAPEDAHVDDPGAEPALFTLPKWRRHSLFLCCSFLMFLLQFDFAAVAVTIPIIAKDENATQVKAFALATGYFLAQTVFQLVFSHVSHALGRKFMFLTGLSFWVLGASIAAGKVHIDALIGARVIQGIGAAGMFTMAAILVVEMTQPRQRAGWVAFSQAWGALGNICGPFAAGGMSYKGWSWNSIFAVQVIAASLLFAILMYLLPWDNRSLRGRLYELKRCDWIGMGLFFACAVALLVPINVGGATESTPWKSVPVLLTFGAGLFALVLLIFQQRKWPPERPVFPAEVFARRPTTGTWPLRKIFISIGPWIAFLGNTVCGILLFAVFYTLVIFWEGVRRKSTVMVGVMMSTMSITYPVAFALTGLAIKQWGRIRPAIFVGASLSTLGLCCMQSVMKEDTPEPFLILICLVAGAGCGVFTPAMVNAVLALTDSRWHAHAIATRTLLYTAGQCMGVSLGTAIFTGTFKTSYEAHEGDSEFEALVAQIGNPQGLISQIRELPPGSVVVDMVVAALQCVWLFASVTAGLTGVLAILMRCPDLPPDRTTQPARPDEEQQPSRIEMSSR